MYPRSIRTRIMLWYVAILAVILVLFSSATYFTLRRTLNESLNDALDNRAFLAQELLVFSANGTPSLELSENDPNRDDSFQRVFSADGSVVFDSSDLFGDIPIQQQALDDARSGRSHIGTVPVGGQHARVLTIPLMQDRIFVGALQVGESTADIDDVLRILLLTFAIALPAALALATAGGFWLSSRALAPIDEITRAAGEISERDLSRRLDLGLPDDEVGRLARTFDGMIARLDAAFQRQRQFTADASHELRTPLAAMRGQIEVALQRPREAGDYRQVLATINEQVERMTRLVGGLLMLARTEAGALPVERARVDIAALVTSVADQIRPLAVQKGLALELDGVGNPAVIGDEDLLLQLLLNLADNAIKYTSAGSVTLAWQQDGSAARIAITDTGPGIDAADQTRIFERFYRVDASRTGEQPGTGLGLAICRWIAEAHGGSLSVESSGSGSTFTLCLPI
jgi:heavy metal sensor kinase